MWKRLQVMAGDDIYCLLPKLPVFFYADTEVVAFSHMKTFRNAVIG